MIPPGCAEYPVWPEHALAVRVFAALETQWVVVAGMSGAFYQGLNYAAVTHDFMDMMGVPKTKRGELFADLREMERAARPVLNDRE